MSALLERAPASALRVKQSVSDILDELEIHPFVEESVRKFMNEKRAAADGVLLRSLKRRTLKTRVYASMVLAILIVAVAYMTYFNLENMSYVAICVSLMSAAAIGFGAMTVIANSGETMETEFYKRKHEWRTVPLEYWDRHVPDEVMQQVQEIQARIPGAQFNIHHIVEDPLASISFEGDPENRLLFFAQWDEPGFSAARQV